MLHESFSVLAMLVFGGLGSTAGAVLGAILLTAIPEVFRFAAEYRMLIYGITLVVAVLVRPQGILGKSAFSLPGLQLSSPRTSRSKPRGATQP
jgi:branched-chain amino acid transport system permease protein